MPSFCGNDDAAYSMKGDFLGDGKGGFYYLPQSKVTSPYQVNFLRNNDFPLIYKLRISRIIIKYLCKKNIYYNSSSGRVDEDKTAL